MFLKYHPDFENPFHNNLAQAIEILHFLEESLELIEKLSNKNLERAQEIKNLKLLPKKLTGKACLEAPRGILIHQVEIDSRGTIANYNIIPPTQINLAALKKDAQSLIEQYKTSDQKLLKRYVEELIRAFDSCITCAVH